MIFIYGRKSTQLISEQIPGSCPNCGTPHSTHVFVFQRYLHLFWIPVTPIGKTGVSVCSHCKQTRKLNEMSPDQKTAYNALQQKAKTPVWTFSLLIVIGLSIVAGLIGDAVKGKTHNNSTEQVSSSNSSDVAPATVSSSSPAETKTQYTNIDAQKSMVEFAQLLAAYKEAIKADDGKKNTEVNAKYDVWHDTAMKLLSGLKGADQTEYITFYQESLRKWTDVASGNFK
ncbi:hypothetical protein ACTHGU_21450 [Chitinophagaceae bacterium MMS25-I14]